MNEFKGRLFYLEGPDGAGKTSLIDSVIEEGDLVYHNSAYPTRDMAYKAFMAQYDAAANALEYDLTITVYIDRGPISEIIYGEVLRNEGEVDQRFYDCMNRFDELGGEIIICLPHLSVAKKNWASRLGQELVKKELQYNRIYNKYQNIAERLLSKFKNNVSHYDYTGKL